MPDALSMAERHARDLARLTEWAMELAADLQASAMATDDPKVKADVAAAFHRISRSARQSMALEAKLERDRLAAELAAEEHAEHVRSTRIREHRERVSLPIERLVWHEAERDELMGELENLLDEAELDHGFLDQPVELLIARIAKALGVKRHLPPQGGEGDEVASLTIPPWRSSA